MTSAEQIISRLNDLSVVLEDAQSNAWNCSGILPRNCVVYHFEDGSCMTFQLDDRNQPTAACTGEWQAIA